MAHSSFDQNQPPSTQKQKAELEEENQLLIKVCAVASEYEDDFLWKKADHLKTLEGYKNYLKKHPNGKYSANAKQELGTIDRTIEVVLDIIKNEEQKNGIKNGGVMSTKEGGNVKNMQSVQGNDNTLISGVENSQITINQYFVPQSALPEPPANPENEEKT